jgi:hypothetical protein
MRQKDGWPAQHGARERREVLSLVEITTYHGGVPGGRGYLGGKKKTLQIGHGCNYIDVHPKWHPRGRWLNSESLAAGTGTSKFEVRNSKLETRNFKFEVEDSTQHPGPGPAQFLKNKNCLSILKKHRGSTCSTDQGERFSQVDASCLCHHLRCMEPCSWVSGAANQTAIEGQQERRRLALYC